MKHLSIALAALLAGCANLGPTAEQLKAMPNGGVVCGNLRGIHGSGNVLAINAQELGRNLTAETEITVSPEQGCRTTIRGKASAAARAASAP